MPDREGGLGAARRRHLITPGESPGNFNQPYFWTARGAGDRPSELSAAALRGLSSFFSLGRACDFSILVVSTAPLPYRESRPVLDAIGNLLWLQHGG